MIQEVSNALVTMMLAKFLLNDVPHALGLTGSALRDAWSEVKELLREPEASMQMEEALELGVREKSITPENLRKYKDLLSGYFLIAKERGSDEVVENTYRLAVEVWKRYLKFLALKPQELDEAGMEVSRALEMSYLSRTRLDKVVFIDAIFYYAHEGYHVIELAYAIPDYYGAYAGWLASELSRRDIDVPGT